MKVRDFVRTKEKGFQCPQIARIVKMEKDEGYKNQYYITLDHNLLPDFKFNIYTEDIDKSRARVIELVQVGDYVNGHKVLDIAQEPIRALYLEDISQKGALIPVYEKDIKSIVTKEQFENTQYKVQK